MWSLLLLIQLWDCFETSYDQQAQAENKYTFHTWKRKNHNPQWFIECSTTQLKKGKVKHNSLLLRLENPSMILNTLNLYGTFPPMFFSTPLWLLKSTHNPSIPHITCNICKELFNEWECYKNHILDLDDTSNAWIFSPDTIHHLFCSIVATRHSCICMATL